MKKLLQLIKEARFVWVMGNGGSAATAEHFTNDLFSKGIKAICLNSNTSIMTMIANDFEYKDVFRRQIKLFATDEDLLVVISGSGNSENIIRALQSSPCTTFALLGRGGGKAKNFTDYSLTARSNDYGKIENWHLELVHKVKEAL